MKREQLKTLIKPIIKECIHEVIIESGVLSNIVAEVSKGMGNVIVETKQPEVPSEPERNVNQEAIEIQKKRLDEQRKKLSSAIGNKAYANIYKLFEYDSLLSPEERTETHFNLVEYITTSKGDIKLTETIGNANIPNDEDLRILTYRTLLEKFNSKYSKLNLSQKNLLREYINNISNTNSLKEYINKVTPSLKKELNKYKKNVTDKVVKIKLKEAINSINNFCGTGQSKIVKDSVVVQTMRYMELLKELKKCKAKS